MVAGSRGLAGIKGAGMKKGITIGLVAAFAVGALAVSPSALAKDGDVRKQGNCSEGSDWKLKLSEENGKIEVEFEVDQNKVGDKWQVTLKHDGERFYREVKETKGPSGSFEVEKVEPNLQGDDRFVGKALNLSTDEECKGTAVWTK
jgi:hypothetical protein